MSHDIHAAWATAQIAQEINADNSSVYFDEAVSDIYAYASRESKNIWPIADGVIALEHNSKKYSVAIEFKRTNEGLHGVLTALGQAHSYLKKGYDASFIVIPEKYDSHSDPGGHLLSVIEYTSPDVPIAIFTYNEPDPNQTSPFEGKIICRRKISLLASPFGDRSVQEIESRTETQWAHLREGSSDADAFFKYLQIAKRGPDNNTYSISPDLRKAIGIPHPSDEDISKFLSNSAGDAYNDKVWREFWFKHVLTPDVSNMVELSDSGYEPVLAPTNIMLPNGSQKMFFAGRSDSFKNKAAENINNGTITINQAWQDFAINIRNRAHSYREDIDSGLEHIGMLESDGRPTQLGYEFVDACERSGNSNVGKPSKILSKAIIKNGQLGALLHYIYRLSEKVFKDNPYAFTGSVNGRTIFKQKDYLLWLEDKLANELNVMRKVGQRGGAQRQPFQAELAILRHFDLVGGFRIGVGLEIHWPSLQELIE